MRSLRAEGERLPFFAPLSLTVELARPALLSEGRSGLADVTVVSPGHWVTPAGQTFSAEFQEAFGSPPRAVAAYAYDATAVILEAIRQAGVEREAIRDALSGIDYKNGITGSIAFDEFGNRLGEIATAEIAGD